MSAPIAGTVSTAWQVAPHRYDQKATGSHWLAAHSLGQSIVSIDALGSMQRTEPAI